MRPVFLEDPVTKHHSPEAVTRAETRAGTKAVARVVGSHEARTTLTTLATRDMVTPRSGFSMPQSRNPRTPTPVFVRGIRLARTVVHVFEGLATTAFVFPFAG